MTTYETALYGPDGKLVKTAKAYPPNPEVSPQECADRMARAADLGCTYKAGIFYVWKELATPAPLRVVEAVTPDGRTQFGDL